MPETTLHLVRHGEVHNPDDILYGRMPRFRLSERGREQARAAADYLAKQSIAGLYSSPLLRARQTARIIGDRVALPVRQSKYLIEIYSPYQGRTHAELEAMGWNIYEGIPAGYDQPADILARLQAFTRRIRKAHPGEAVVAVTHGDIVLHAQLWARGMDLTHANRRSIQPYPGTASINTLVFREGQTLPEFRFHLPY
jgi:broad specificity phosphatase PhoE